MNAKAPIDQPSRAGLAQALRDLEARASYGSGSIEPEQGALCATTC
jgi:hypothetical protein